MKSSSSGPAWAITTEENPWLKCCFVHSNSSYALALLLFPVGHPACLLLLPFLTFPVWLYRARTFSHLGCFMKVGVTPG